MSETAMPIESALVSVLVLVLVLFAGLALVLAWAERKTRNGRLS
jgi:CHASE3 domain sensor protein